MGENNKIKYTGIDRLKEIFQYIKFLLTDFEKCHMTFSDMNEFHTKLEAGEIPENTLCFVKGAGGSGVSVNVLHDQVIGLKESIDEINKDVSETSISVNVLHDQVIGLKESMDEISKDISKSIIVNTINSFNVTIAANDKISEDFYVMIPEGYTCLGLLQVEMTNSVFNIARAYYSNDQVHITIENKSSYQLTTNLVMHLLCIKNS